MWTYAYQLVPPQTEERVRTIKALLARERSDAQRGSRVWLGKVIRAPQVTHILVVSDSPAQDLEVNRRLEAALDALQVGFLVTAPLATADDV
jgi:hypothetical protein